MRIDGEEGIIECDACGGEGLREDAIETSQGLLCPFCAVNADAEDEEEGESYEE